MRISHACPTADVPHAYTSHAETLRAQEQFTILAEVCTTTKRSEQLIGGPSSPVRGTSPRDAEDLQAV